MQMQIRELGVSARHFAGCCIWRRRGIPFHLNCGNLCVCGDMTQHTRCVGDLPRRHWVPIGRLLLDVAPIQGQLLAEAVEWNRNPPLSTGHGEEMRLASEEITKIYQKWESQRPGRYIDEEKQPLLAISDWITVGGSVIAWAEWLQMTTETNAEDNARPKPLSLESGASGWHCDPEWRWVRIIKKGQINCKHE